MIKSKICVLTLFILMTFVLLGSVSATDVGTSDADMLSANDDGEIVAMEDSLDVSDGIAKTDANLLSSDDYEAAGIENDLEVRSEDSGNFSKLADEIANKPSVELKYKYYKYDSGNTIQITINDAVINGNGAVIDMADSTIQPFRVIASGVVIKNLTIKNVNYGGDGGAIYFNSSGTVENCNFADNNASRGAAIYFYRDAAGEVTNCNFTNNSAFEGGAVYFYDGGEVTDCNFVNNTAGYQGGAIKMDSGAVRICDFLSNSAKNSGGAIYMDSGAVENCNFTNNKGIDNPSYGGAVIFNYESKVTNCSFINNSAFHGGAIHLLESSNVTNCKFINNSANEGGAIHSRDTCTADTCVFKTSSDTYVNTLIFTPTLNVDNFTTFYGSGEKLTFDLKTNSSMQVYNGNISISVYNKENGAWINNYSCLSGEGWIVDLQVGSYYAIFDTEYSGFQPINRTITTTPSNSFWALNQIINANDNPVINLANDYYYDPTYDGAFASGIAINRKVTINGNGHTIDAKWEAEAFHVRTGDVTISNLTIKNGYNGDYGGVIYFDAAGTVMNCNFVNNVATSSIKGGGAIFFSSFGNVTNCNFTGNSAENGGAIFFSSSGNVTNCNFVNNSAIKGYGGAISIYSGNVVNCNFVNNSAVSRGGGAISMYFGSVRNCNFTANNAYEGSAIYFNDQSGVKSISNSIFLNNHANTKAFGISINENNITIIFIGMNNLLNAIHSGDGVSFTNVTYWGANGITNTGNSAVVLSPSENEAGQNMTIGVVVDDKLVLNEVKVTDENGTIVLNISVGENYCISIRHDEDSYYTEFKAWIPNMNFCVNVTETKATNKTVNMTAKSNIYADFMPGGLQFILQNGVKINATYAADGIWWAVHTFDDYSDYLVNATYVGLPDVVINNATISITRANSTVNIPDIVLDYGDSKNITVTTEGATGITAMIDGNPVDVVNNYTIPISGLDIGNHTLTVTTMADGDHNPVTETVNITVNKLKTEITADSITATYNINKDLVITLKDAKGNAMAGVQITVDLNGAKTYTTDKNGQVKVSTNGLIPKAYTAKIAFNGNTIYSKSTREVKVTVKKATPKLTAKKKTFKRSKKVKKYTVTFKNNVGKAMKKAKLTIKIGKKTYKATVNAKGKATFKIKKLTKKGKYNAVIKYKGDKCYNKVTKKVKITIK